MRLFNRKKGAKASCCHAAYTPDKMKDAQTARQTNGIKILGGGCAKCHALEANTKAALAQMGIQQTVELVTDFAVIATYGVMSTPALVIDGNVVSYGKALTTAEIKILLQKVR